MTEESPLSSMGVSGKNKLDRAGNERKILGMMRKQDVIAGSGTVLLQPSCLWLVSRCCNRPVNSADALLAWITVGAAGFSTETSIVRNVSGVQASQNHFLAVHGNGLPFIIQHRHAGCVDSSEILLVQHPFMIAERHEGRGDGSAGRQERQDVFLCF